MEIEPSAQHTFLQEQLLNPPPLSNSAPPQIPSPGLRSPHAPHPRTRLPGNSPAIPCKAKSRGQNTKATFGSILADEILLTFRASNNFPIILKRSTSSIDTTCFVFDPNFPCSFSTCCKITSLRNFKDSPWLLKCFWVLSRPNQMNPQFLEGFDYFCLCV